MPPFLMDEAKLVIRPGIGCVQFYGLFVSIDSRRYPILNPVDVAHFSPGNRPVGIYAVPVKGLPE